MTLLLGVTNEVLCNIDKGLDIKIGTLHVHVSAQRLFRTDQ